MFRVLKLLLALLALAGCTGRSPCTQEGLRAMRLLYTGAARRVIESGACDQHIRVEDCPEYRLVEVQFETAAGELCR